MTKCDYCHKQLLLPLRHVISLEIDKENTKYFCSTLCETKWKKHNGYQNIDEQDKQGYQQGFLYKFEFRDDKGEIMDTLDYIKNDDFVFFSFDRFSINKALALLQYLKKEGFKIISHSSWQYNYNMVLEKQL